MATHISADGIRCNPDDPKRLVWYAAGCSFWTDDFDMLNQSGQIPVCPHCGAPGYQSSAADWESGAKTFAAASGEAGYVEWLQSIRGKCHGRGQDNTGMRLWEKHKAEQGRPVEPNHILEDVAQAIAKELEKMPAMIDNAMKGGAAFRYKKFAFPGGGHPDFGYGIFYVPLDLYPEVLAFVQGKLGTPDEESEIIIEKDVMAPITKEKK